MTLGVLPSVDQYCGVDSGLVMKVLFHSQQLWLVTAGEDGVINVYDLVSKSLAAALKVRDAVVSVIDSYQLKLRLTILSQSVTD